VKSFLPAWVAIAALPFGALPALAQESVPSGPACADRPALEAERAALKSQITGIAMAGSDRRQRRRSAQAGKMAAQAVVGLFIPFGIGMAVGGTVALAEAAEKQAKAKRPKPPPPPEPDVPAMIARQQSIEAQLVKLASACTSRSPAAASATE
jgi:hypothetical protein